MDEAACRQVQANSQGIGQEEGGHILLMARVLPPGEGTVLACLRCGGYAWKGAELLKQQCLGPPQRGSTRAARKRRLLSGVFPHERYPGRLGPFWRPTAAALEWLRMRHLGTGEEPTTLAALAKAAHWGSLEHKQRLLAWSGLTLAQVQALGEEEQRSEEDDEV